jgi:hypothetical protein
MYAVILILNLLYEHRKTTRSASTDLCGHNALFPSLTLCIQPACVTARRAAQHVDLLGLPVNLGVVLAEPGEAQDHALLAQLCNCKLSALCMPIVPEDDICNPVDCTALIGCSIDIVDWDWPSECAHGDIICTCPFGIHKQPHCTTVDQQPSAVFDTSVCGLDFNVDVKGVGTRSGGNDVPTR